MAASDRVRFGMIGIGMQGSGLLSCRHSNCREWSASPPAISTTDVTRWPRNCPPDLPATRRYHELLENKDIDCIVAAVPDHWHKQVVVDAVSAGKDIYSKSPCRTPPADGVEMVAAAKKTDASCRSARSASVP